MSSSRPSIKEMSLEERKRCAQVVSAKHQDHVPIILTKFSIHQPDVPRVKYIVPRTMSIKDFAQGVAMELGVDRVSLYRENISLWHYLIALFYPSIALLPEEMSIDQVYQSYKEEDDLLYLLYRV